MSKKEARAQDYDVILRPIFTEKSTMGSEHNQYTFKVAPSATKPAIAEAVERIWGVDVLSVNTLNVTGKHKRFRGVLGKRADSKKAIVRIKDGQSIDIATGV